MKKYEVTIAITISDKVDADLLIGSIMDDAIRAYPPIEEIEYGKSSIVEVDE